MRRARLEAVRGRTTGRHSTSNNDGNLYVTAVCYSTNFSGFPVYNPGDGQALLLRMDTLNGALRWVRSYGGSQRDFAADMKIATNGDVIISGSTLSNDYDISGNHGNYDGLVFRVIPANRIKGNVFIDNVAEACHVFFVSIYHPGQSYSRR